MSVKSVKLNPALIAAEAIDKLQRQVRAWAIREALRYRLKQERQQLAAMSDEMLRDLGISRADAEAEAASREIPAARLDLRTL